MPIPGLKTHKPSGAVPFPLILVEGEEKAGKSWAVAELTRSDKTGTLYWIDLNEGAAEEYGAIDGVDYEVVEHRGSYQELLNAIELIHAEAKRAAEAGEPPVVLAIDSGTAIWNGLKDWATDRARNTDKNKAILAKNADAEITVSTNFWNDAGARWRRIQTLLMTFPGIAIITARGKEVTVMDDAGRPTKEKTWSVETHRELPYSATVWLRLTRDANPQIVGARSVHAGIRPGVDRPKKITGSGWDGRLLEWLVFDVLKCDPAKAQVREVAEFHGGALMDHEKVSEADAAKAVAAEQAAGQPSQVGQVTAAAQQAARQPRRGAERPAERPAGKTAEQWVADVKAADSRDQLNELHAAATAAGQLTPGLLTKMQERAAELAKPAPAEQSAEQPAAAAEAPAEQPAEVPQEEDGITEGDRCNMLVDEIKMIAELVGKSPAQLTARHLPDGPRAVPVAKLQEVVAGLRGLAIIKLKQNGRTAEAAAYAKVKPTECDAPANLLTDPEAPQADGEQADKAA